MKAFHALIVAVLFSTLLHPVAGGVIQWNNIPDTSNDNLDYYLELENQNGERMVLLPRGVRLEAIPLLENVLDVIIPFREKAGEPGALFEVRAGSINGPRQDCDPQGIFLIWELPYISLQPISNPRDDCSNAALPYVRDFSISLQSANGIDVQNNRVNIEITSDSFLPEGATATFNALDLEGRQVTADKVKTQIAVQAPSSGGTGTGTSTGSTGTSAGGSTTSPSSTGTPTSSSADQIDCSTLTNPLHNELCIKMVGEYNQGLSKCQRYTAKATTLNVAPLIDQHIQAEPLLTRSLVLATMYAESTFEPTAMHQLSTGEAFFIPNADDQADACTNGDPGDSFGLMQITKGNIDRGQLNSGMTCATWADPSRNIASGVQIWSESNDVARGKGCSVEPIAQFDGLNGEAITTIALYNNRAGSQCAAITGSAAEHTKTYVARILAWNKLFSNNCQGAEMVIQQPSAPPTLAAQDLQCTTILDCLVKLGKRFVGDVVE